MLPDSPEEFFTWYSHSVRTNLLSLEECRDWLRKAWQQYPKNRGRIEQTAKVITIALNRPKRTIAPEQVSSDLEKNVMETML